MDRSLGFGSTAGNYCRPLRTRFPSGSGTYHALTSLPTVTRRLILQKARHHRPCRPALTACRSTVSGSHFTPLPGSFSPFPHGTSSLSVAVSYLALEGGPPNFPQDFSCPTVLRFRTHGAARISCTGLSPPPVALPSGVPLYMRFLNSARAHARPPARPYDPHYATVHTLHIAGLGSSPFARRY
jgi:hypothetical protein